MKRWILLAAGWTCVGLALAGAVLPLLPTTPFLLLAAACFVRSSPALHRRLLAHERLGPYLAQWQHDRSVPKEAKRKAYALIVASFSLSIYVVDPTWLRIVLVLLACALCAFIASLRTGAPM